MPTEHEALESKRRYVESLTRSAITEDLSYEGLEIPEPLQENNEIRPLKKQITLQLHVQIVLPVTDDVKIYDQIFSSLKHHFF